MTLAAEGVSRLSRNTVFVSSDRESSSPIHPPEKQINQGEKFSWRTIEPRACGPRAVAKTILTPELAN
jgi:hypothetical protein